MNYSLKFLPTAFKEWKKLDNTIRSQLKKKLRDCLLNPHVVGNELRGFKNHYKIKLKARGYRLVYEVIDRDLYILVIAVGKRNKNEVYNQVKKRSQES